MQVCMYIPASPFSDFEFACLLLTSSWCLNQPIIINLTLHWTFLPSCLPSAYPQPAPNDTEHEGCEKQGNENEKGALFLLD